MENITGKKQIANLLATTISNNSSHHYSQKFQAIKTQKEKEKSENHIK